MTNAIPQDNFPDRRHDLDWIRVGAFFLLILYHVGMFYVPWDWHVKSPRPVEWLEPVMQLTSPWRLTLLFLVSGMATRFMADKLTARSLAGQRTWRLLPPLVFAMFVIVPPQSYYEIVEQIGYAGSFADFYGPYATGSGDWCDADGCLTTPTWNHMWFVAYLFVYTLVLAVLWGFARGPLTRFGAWLGGALKGWGLVLAPIAYLAVCRILLLPLFDVSHALVDDWYNHAVSFGAFLFGFLLAKSDAFRQATIRLRWPALVLALCAWAAWSIYFWTYRDGSAPPEALRQTMRVVFATDQWCAILAVLGFGAKHLNRGGPALRYLTLAVFPFYIVHQTVIVVAAYHLAKLGLNQALESALVIGLTFAACFATYEVVRRVAVLRPLFGLKWRDADAANASRPRRLASLG